MCRLQAELTSEGEDEAGVFVYELYATVAHVDDHRTCGNLVANVKVGDSYHRRKEGVTCNQWYLINDFSIAPIDHVSNKRHRRHVGAMTSYRRTCL